MKKTIGIGLALTVLASASFAMEINGGKLLSHKEWTTKNVTGSVKETLHTQKKGLFNKNNKMTDMGYDGIYVEDRLVDVPNGVVGNSVSAYGYTGVDIANFTQTQQIYSIVNSFCSESEQDNLD